MGESVSGSAAGKMKSFYQTDAETFSDKPTFFSQCAHFGEIPGSQDYVKSRLLATITDNPMAKNKDNS